MKRKIFSFVLICLFILPLCFAFSACNYDNSGDNAQQQVTPQADYTLQMNKKYILKDSTREDESKQTFFVFYENGTGRYKYYSASETSSLISSYMINFKWIFTNNAKDKLVCFYNNISFFPENNFDSPSSKTNWTKIMNVSTNVLHEENYDGCYINENYLTSIPNFGETK